MEAAADRTIKILVVDDDQAIADIFQELLVQSGRKVDACYDGLAAIDLLKQKRHTPYDIVMVDLMMPKVDGLEVLKFAKTVNADIIVIIITGYASLETAITAIREGAYDYIQKPCKLEEIRIVVDNAIEKIRLNRENKELLFKLQEAYRELKSCRQGPEKPEKAKSLNIFSSSAPNLHHIYNQETGSGQYLDKLQTLQELKKNGTITDLEFKALKHNLLKTVNPGGYAGDLE